MRTGSPRIHPSSCRRRVPHTKWEEEPTQMRAEGWCWWIHSSESRVRAAQCHLTSPSVSPALAPTPHCNGSKSPRCAVLSVGDCILRRAGVLSRAVDAGVLGPVMRECAQDGDGRRVRSGAGMVSLYCASSLVSMALGARGRRMRDGTPKPIALSRASAFLRRHEAWGGVSLSAHSRGVVESWCAGERISRLANRLHCSRGQVGISMPSACVRATQQGCGLGSHACAQHVPA
ncbi:hypothetical protein B0H13DRAFT_931447 [Mycena leptocephala]|nr:hypothetical protein B0H13DRAFT_931447 [Mycena leptocephala]